MGEMQRDSQDTTVTLGTGSGTASSEVIIAGWAFGRLEFPSAMTGTKLLIESYNTDGNWVPCNNGGTQLEIVFTASTSERIPDAAFGASKIRFKSDGNESSARTFYVHLSG